VAKIRNFRSAITVFEATSIACTTCVPGSYPASRSSVGVLDVKPGPRAVETRPPARPLGTSNRTSSRVSPLFGSISTCRSANEPTNSERGFSRMATGSMASPP
jgi:hypothetical protein